ncbi:MAG: tetratricopeptide repeat protein [Myxococcaceae bacterium]|nr:tetratricopeptide repeat protein [Myxococcaceae bacterium]
MVSPQQGKTRPVTVIHFPKQGKQAPRRPTVSITELKAVGRDEDATDPQVVVTPEPKAGERAPGAPAKAKKKTGESPLPEAHVAHVDLKRGHTPQEAADLAAFGHRLFELGKLDEARVIFEKLVNAETRDAFVHTMLGTVYLALNAQDRALALFQAALKLDPDDLAAVVYRGEIRLNRGKLKAAVEDLQRAIGLGPSTDPFVERAKRLMKMAKHLAKKKK